MFIFEKENVQLIASPFLDLFFFIGLLIVFDRKLALAKAKDDMVVDESVVRRSLVKAEVNVPTEL